VPFHVQLSGQGAKDWGGTFSFDLTAEQLEERVLEPYRAGRPITLGGETFQPGPGLKIRITETGKTSVELRTGAKNRASLNARKLGATTLTRWEVVLMGWGKDRTDEFITAPPGEAPKASGAPLSAVERLVRMCARFPRVARQLEARGRERQPVMIDDEYDLQYVFGGLLALEFDDVRKEEWTPSYAGSAAKVDFLLKGERTVLELKRTRRGLGDRDVGKQLIEDIAHYRASSDCDHLVCFVYDPEGRISNPDGLVADLEAHPPSGLTVRVVIGR
jgi:hypothetical protein